MTILHRELLAGNWDAVKRRAASHPQEIRSTCVISFSLFDQRVPMDVLDTMLHQDRLYANHSQLPHMICTRINGYAVVALISGLLCEEGDGPARLSDLLVMIDKYAPEAWFEQVRCGENFLAALFAQFYEGSASFENFYAACKYLIDLHPELAQTQFGDLHSDGTRRVSLVDFVLVHQWYQADHPKKLLDLILPKGDGNVLHRMILSGLVTKISFVALMALRCDDDQERVHLMCEQDSMQGDTPLHRALRSCTDEEVIDGIIYCALVFDQRRRSLFVVNNDGQTPFDLAFSRRDHRITRALFDMAPSCFEKYSVPDSLYPLLFADHGVFGAITASEGSAFVEPSAMRRDISSTKARPPSTFFEVLRSRPEIVLQATTRSASGTESASRAELTDVVGVGDVLFEAYEHVGERETKRARHT